MIGYRVHGAETAPADWFDPHLPPLLVRQAIQGGGVLDFDGTLSATLRRKVPRIGRHYGVGLDVRGRTEARTPQGSGTGLLFSGGVDSFHALACVPQVTHLVCVLGFDVRKRAACDALATRAREAAALFGKRLVLVESDVRDALGIGDSEWGRWHCGAALAGVALLLQPTLSRCLVASSAPLSPSASDDVFERRARDRAFRWGSRPWIDPLWSTEAVEISHYGADRNRAEKVADLCAMRPDAVPLLRVCPKGGAGNCGECPKCRRTDAVLARYGYRLNTGAT